MVVICVGTYVSGLQSLTTKKHKIKQNSFNVQFEPISENESKLSPSKDHIEGRPSSGDHTKAEPPPDDVEPSPLATDGSEGREGPKKVEVSNVPETVNEEVLKAFFEGPKSGGCAGAVADVVKVAGGVFQVTFHDPAGMILALV